MTGLSAADRSLINRSRALASARGADAFRVATGQQYEASDVAAHIHALGYAQGLLGELAALAEREQLEVLGGGQRWVILSPDGAVSVPCAPGLQRGD